MLRRILGVSVLALSVSGRAVSSQARVVVSSQPPLALGQLQLPSELALPLREAMVQKAGKYPFVGFRLFGSDSALLVFDDSTLTADALRTKTWVFGPPVTVAEADGCPPEKVLGRKIARVFWRGWGRPPDAQYVMVAVRGTRGRDRWTVETMYYLLNQLEGPWAGDPESR